MFIIVHKSSLDVKTAHYDLSIAQNAYLYVCSLCLLSWYLLYNYITLQYAYNILV